MRYLLCGILWFSSLTLWSQNLVPNPGFEEFTKCPSGFSTNRNDFQIYGWQSPTNGTPDHFHSCSSGDSDVPINWAGNSNAHNGKGYAGIYVWRTTANYREYLQGELASPLNPGDKYILEFYYKLANHAVFAINRMGLALVHEPVNVANDKVLGITPVLSIEGDTAITTETGTWEHARIEYTAEGGERYVVIGNFFNNSQTKVTRLPFRYGQNPMLNFASYYYIDDVSVRAVDTTQRVISPNTLAPLTPERIEISRDYTLKDIKFEFDSYVIHPSSNDELNKVVAYLKANPWVNVRLSGHTDLVGSDEYNLTLSRNRTKSIADFFVAKGIEQGRVVSYGFGKSRPLSLEKTDEAQRINRRVEIRFVPKQ